MQVVSGPETEGDELTLIILVIKHPEPTVYVISHVPTPIPVTTPVVNPIVAMPGQRQLQEPPAGVLVIVAVVPTHTADGPPIAVGNALTVMMLMALQPVVAVMVIIHVPAPMPVTTPVVASTDAIVGQVLLHVPGAVLASVVV
jgi:hypothetical protein